MYKTMSTITKKTFTCELCNKGFSTKSNLKQHTRSIHDNTIAFNCNKCDKVFNQKSNFKYHIKTVHEKIKSFHCDKCDKYFFQKTSLKYHISAVHKGIKPFSCNICNYACGLKTTLLLHIKSHENDGKRGSKGERAVMEILNLMGVEYLYDKPFESLKGLTNTSLKFDFIIPTKDEGYLFIEFDGRHHFKPVCYGGMQMDKAIEKFKLQQVHDLIKDDFCSKRDYPMLRIKYDQIGILDQLVIDFVLQNNVI
jgi:hypothetical protein